MNTLIAIVLATLAAGIGSVWLAAVVMRLGRMTGAASTAQRGSGEQQLLSLAAGALLATAFMHLLPEALEGEAGAKALFATLLVGVVFFFLLDKAELWHHGHEHHAPSPALPPGGTEEEVSHPSRGREEEGATHDHGHVRGPGHDHAHARAHGHHHQQHATPLGSWAVLTGDSVHCFGDGILIASAFVADWRLGLVAALAVLAHEVPHHIGDLAVLGQSSGSRQAALVKVSLAGAVTPLGGIVGWWLVDRLVQFLPYFLVVASSSFIYVALADLIPQLQKRLGARETLAQIGWLLAGIAMVMVASSLAHAH